MDNESLTLITVNVSVRQIVIAFFSVFLHHFVTNALNPSKPLIIKTFETAKNLFYKAFLFVA